MKKISTSTVGFLQAVGVLFYVGIATGFLRLMGYYFTHDPGFLGVILMLLLLVVSAAITGAIVFGYSAYLVLNQKIKEAIILFGYTVLYLLGFAIIILVLLSTL